MVFSARDWFILLGISASVAFGVAVTGRYSVPTWGAEEADAWLDSQAEVARGMGLTLAEISQLAVDRRGQAEFPLSLAEGECVAVLVAAAHDSQRLSMTLREGGLELAGAAEHSEGTELQWCSPSETTLTVSVHVSGASGAGSRGPLATRVYRGRLDGGLGALRRGYIAERVMADLGRRRVSELEEQVFPDRTRLGGPIPLQLREGARLLPATLATRETLRRQASNDQGVAVNPRVDLRDLPGLPPRQSPSEAADVDSGADGATPAHDALVKVDGEWLRVLAVVDLGALGADCVTLSLGRATDSRDSKLSVVAAGETTRELSADRGLYVDDSCPAAGIVSYAVSRRDGADYQLSVWRMAAPAGTPRAEPSGPPPPLREQLRRECDAGSASACAALSEGRRQGRFGEPDPGAAQDLARRACELGDVTGCVLQQAEAPTSEARAVFQSACDSSVGVGCAYLGDLERLGDAEHPADYPAAARSYDRACERGVASACLNRGLLASLGIHDGLTTAQLTSRFETACMGGIARGCSLALMQLVGRHGVRRARRDRLRSRGCDLGLSRLCE